MNCHLAYYSLWGFTIGSSPTPIQKMVVQLREIFLKFLLWFYLPAGKCVEFVELVTNGEAGVEAVKMSV
jgi:hypothetical protein